MNQLTLILSEMDNIISFGTDLSGTILAASKPAAKAYPDCIGMSLTAVLPQYFDPEYPPVFSAFDYHHTLRTKGGSRLDISRFGDSLLFRELPAAEEPQLDLEKLPDEVYAASLEQIRLAVESAVHSHSAVEDVFNDLDLYNAQDYKTVTDSLRDANMDCRRICLACNRLEMAEPLTELYPPQRVVLTEALWELTHSIRVDLPGLAMPVREMLPPYPVTVQVNWELLRRAILEVVRHSAAVSGKREGTTVFGIHLLEQKDTCTIRLSDNYSGILSPDDEQTGEENPARIYRYVEKVMACFGGSVSPSQTDYGDRALDLILPLGAGFSPADNAFTLHAGNSYKSYEEQNLSAPLIYLEEFAK